MPDEISVTPVVEPVAPAAAPERKFRTIAEEKFFAKREASSLPNTSTEPSTQEPISEVPAPSAPDTPVVDEPVVPPVIDAVEPPTEPPALAEDDFSVELPGSTIPEDGVLLNTDVRHPDSPLAETAPKWQHDAFNRLQSDPNISPEDKKTISELPPSAWDKARKWQADTKLLGQFRNAEVPISAVFDTLTRQSRERVAELETEALNRMLTNPEGMVAYSSAHPREYAEVMAALINDHSDFVASALQKRGFKVVKAEPFDKDKIINDLKQHPLWETFSETEIADLVTSKIEELSGMISTTALTPDELAAQMDKPQATPAMATEAIQKIQTAIVGAKTEQWTKAIGDGLQANGIKPATQAEIAKNPALAHLKTIVYNAALYGLDGVISNWDEHSAKWGQTRPGFSETFDELASYLQDGDIDRFTDGAPGMNPFYFEFGQKRAQTALVQNLYKAIDKLMQETAPVPVPQPITPTTPPTTNGQPSPVDGGRQYRTNSERRFFESRGK